jgi:putative N-acetyltransferase (TIGR04045 family)
MVPMNPPFRFVPGEYRIKHVTEAWERRACAALRRAVFCEEQCLFEHDDADAVDRQALPIAAIACMAGIAERVVGTVRIHRIGAHEWQGSRLAVQTDYRGAAWLGSQLIVHAVRTARARGCRRFVAQVQLQNAALFERLHWRALSRTELAGRPHVLMEAELAHYPPRVDDEVAFYSAVRSAA